MGQFGQLECLIEQGHDELNVIEMYRDTKMWEIVAEARSSAPSNTNKRGPIPGVSYTGAVRP
jgi:hypothetical protein